MSGFGQIRLQLVEGRLRLLEIATSKPSVNQPYIDASKSEDASWLPRSSQRRARLVVARNSHPLAVCCRATASPWCRLASAASSPAPRASSGNSARPHVLALLRAWAADHLGRAASGKI
jgi:hypothetical protein